MFYYRVRSPVILIEFDHPHPIARSDTPTRNHTHTVVRTPNGNGMDLLRQGATPARPQDKQSNCYSALNSAYPAIAITASEPQVQQNARTSCSCAVT